MDVTFKSLSKIIEDEPSIRIKSTRELGVAVSCDTDGVVVETDYGAEEYPYDEIEMSNKYMTKRELINMLENSELDDDDHITIWNGLVDDYVDISDNVVIVELYKEKLSFKRKIVLMDIFQTSKKLEEDLTEEELKKVDKLALKYYTENNEYSEPNRFVEENRFFDWYEDTPIKRGVLNCLLKNKTYADRIGSISY